jgi:hypothetical protein
MLDLYALPRDFPGFTTKEQTRDPYQRVARIEQAMGEALSHQSFIPYLQLHEFEALLLADPQQIAREYPGRADAVGALVTEVAAFKGPEWVDDGETTAPSKRIAAAVPEYDKVLAGPLIAIRIGLPRLRDGCPHFAEWLGKLEALGQA